MTAIDYQILYKSQVRLGELATLSRDWTLFLSALNFSDRVKGTFDLVDADTKHWLVHDEYCYDDNELPADHTFAPRTLNEAEFWQSYEAAAHPDLDGKVCLDITGFMRPHIAYFAAWLLARGVDRFLALYTEPKQYTSQESTEFTQGPVVRTRQIAGFEGMHTPDTSNDLLIIGVGFEDELIRRVAEDKPNAQKLQLFGLPSLHADMYQQSVLQASRVAEAERSNVLFAPANDPFVTAQVLHERVAEEEKRKPITNLYLTALGTKPQTLGFALYYLTERQGTATSMVFPYAERYARETSSGIARVWLYDVQTLPYTP